MNCIKPIALLLWLALLCPLAKAQVDCTFDADQQELISQDSSYYWQYHQHSNYVNWFRRNITLTQTYSQHGASTQALTCRRTIFTIPVVFHVMYDPSVPSTNVSDTLIEAQLEILNAAYANAMGSSHPNAANTQIQFCMAQKDPSGASFSGINRVSYTGTHIKPNGAQKTALATSAYFDPQRYLNIWIVKDIKDTSNVSMNVGGYSNINYTLGIDGVVLRYDFMGDYANCNSCFNSQSKGLVLVHEIGHYLGLYHTFQGGCTGGVDSTNCRTQGDLCCDTRPSQQTFDCPTGSTVPDCPSLPFYGTADDNRNNHMSYADQVCKNNFTLNQAEIMQAVLLGSRRGLVDAKNINSLALGCCHTTAWFTATNTFLCEPDTVRFTAVQQTGASYRWVITRGATTVLDSTLSTHLLNYYANTQGFYNVLLSVIKGTDTTAVIRNSYIERANCGTNLASTQGNWYFGKYAGLRFTTVGVVKDLTASFNPRSINSGEGTISHSDNNGNLLFCAGGDSANLPYFRLYKPNGASHVQVNTANPLKGHQSSTQGGIVIPLDNDTNKFFLVVTGGGIGQYYSRPLNNIFRRTMGARYTLIDKTNPNLVVLPDTNMIIAPPVGGGDADDGTLLSAEYITAIPRCGGGHWLILIDDGGGSSDKKLLVYKVDSTGITYHSTCNKVLENSYSGQMKASPNGNFIACPGYIFRFNNSTGTATFMKEYGVFDPLLYSDYYGVSFSPNSELLYVTLVDSTISTRLVQYDLMSSNDSLSKQLIRIPETFNYFNSLQLAPDNRIYLSNDGVPQLGVINFPNNLNTPFNPNNCGFTLDGPMLQNSNGEGGSCRAGLPNMIDALTPNLFTLGFTHVDSNCRTVKFYPNKYCDSVKKWYFGDGDSSASQMPIHTYASNDSFKVKMVMWNGDSAVRIIKIGLDTPMITGTSFVVCDTTALYSYSISNRQDNLYYTWSVTNGTLSGIDSLNVIADVFWSGTNNALMVQADDRRTGCRAYDTLVITRGATPQSDSLWATPPPCTKGSQFVLKSHTLSGASYMWYKSTDSVNWTVLSGQTTDTLTDIITTDSIYYRRNISTTGCSAFSVVKKMQPQVYIQRQPQNSVSCLGGWREFSIGIENPSGTSITPQWQHQFKNGTGWSAQIDLGDTIRDYPTTIAYDSAKYRCTINTPCGTLISDTGYVLIEKFPNIISHPQSQTKAVGDSVIFTVSSSALKPYFTWYLNRNGNTVWDSIAGEHDDTLIIRNLTSCENRNKYRVVSTICNNDTSNLATLTVTSQSDLWAKDGAADIGTEPNVDPNNDYWGSPDLWNCWPDSTCLTHKSPEYVSVAWNYLRTKVRNNGSVSSNPFQVKTYWTLGGFYEQWPLSWHYDTINNGHYDSITMQRYPMGGEIGTVSSSGIGANDTLIATYQWAPPHPSWYTTTPYFDSSKISHPLCVLSRIESCPDTPFGMTFPEIIPTGVNVKNNNNIVTHNTAVYDSIGTNKKTPEWVLRMGNQWLDERKIKLTIDNPVTNYWDLGYYVLQLDPHIYSAWEEGGSNGEGFTLDGNTFYIYDDGFFLDNIVLDPNEWGWAHFQFRLYPQTVMDEDRGQQLFRFVQYSAPVSTGVEEADGGFNFLLNLKPDTAYVDPHIDSLNFVIAPNPTSGSTVNVGITTNFTTSSATLYIFDNWGYSMINPMGLGTLTEGANSRTVNISGLSAGTYTMVIVANGVNYSQTFIVLNE